MSKKEEFKEFAAQNKYLSELVRNGKTTWQSLYETYDIYGRDASIWEDFKNDYNKEEKKTESKVSDGVKSILGNLKNVDMEKLEENIGSLQKALGFLEEIVTLRQDKKEEKRTTKKKSTEIERFFDD
ncbi:MAG: hypothetical protein HFE04_01115 [Bacilli bacterium]|nr:hypothetical protein [Bacilli bacterium]